MKTWLAIAWIVCIGVAPAGAETVLDNFDADGGFHPTDNVVAAAVFDFVVSGTTRAAARFTVTGGSHGLDSVTLPIAVDAHPPGVHLLRVRLTEDTGGTPGPTLEVLSENEDIWPSLANPFTTTTTLASTSHPLLEDGASYWIVTEPTAMPPGVDLDVRWSYNTSGIQVVARQQDQFQALVADPWPAQALSLPIAFRVEGTLVTECNDGVDDDGDGAVDALDPGCVAPSDLSEQDPTLPCDDGDDNDGDGDIDHRPGGGGDPACQTPAGPREDAQCDDGIDNDGDGGIDWDGGGFRAPPDPQCVDKPWRHRERPSKGCGLGGELALLIPALVALRRGRPAPASRTSDRRPEPEDRLESSQ